jgi:hypothetical protein
VFQLADSVPTQYRALVLMTTFACLRWGEVAALQRQDIDTVTGTPALHFHHLGTPGTRWPRGPVQAHAT